MVLTKRIIMGGQELFTESVHKLLGFEEIVHFSMFPDLT
jgi:hypothetical protein